MYNYTNSGKYKKVLLPVDHNNNIIIVVMPERPLVVETLPIALHTFCVWWTWAVEYIPSHNIIEFSVWMDIIALYVYNTMVKVSREKSQARLWWFIFTKIGYYSCFFYTAAQPIPIAHQESALVYTIVTPSLHSFSQRCQVSLDRISLYLHDCRTHTSPPPHTH